MKKQDSFGINMKRFCRAHEADMEGRLREGRPCPDALRIHLEKLRWLQHERLVHLIVLCLTCLAELFCADLTLLHPQTHPLSALLMLALAVLLGFYFAHYFFLENTTQCWYRLAERLMALEERESANSVQSAVEPHPSRLR